MDAWELSPGWRSTKQAMQQTRLGAHRRGRKTVTHGSRIATPPDGTTGLQHIGLLRERRSTKPGTTGQFASSEFTIKQRTNHAQAGWVGQRPQEISRTLRRGRETSGVALYFHYCEK
jgi:hypothetical protein